ncbi:MAG: V-type ATPase subunit [Anaerofustis sp.]
MSNAKYAAINTKLRGMEAKFLNNRDYESLLEKTDVKEVASYLKTTQAYGRILQGVDIETVNRNDLEHTLKKSMIEDVDRIVKYFSGNDKKFVHSLYSKFEINDMKQLARRLSNAIPKSLIYDNKELNLEFIGKFSGVSPEKVKEAAQISELIEAYDNTVFYKYLKPIVLSDNPNNLFRFETVLDLAYYSILRHESEKLDATNQRLIKMTVGTIGDLLNLQWIYRGMSFYNFMPAELFNYTVDAGYRFSKQKLRDLCYMESVEQLQESIRHTKYAFLIKNNDTTDSFMERRLERYIYFFLRKIRIANPMSIIEAFSHIIYIEYQVRDIITLIEIIKYHLSPEEAQGYLIKYIAERA